jgi:hypothetical protein
LTGDRKPIPFAQTASFEDGAVFAPDGRWIAYHSRENGQSQVLVKPFPPGRGQFQISTRGGSEPMWRADGKELFFLAPDGTMMTTSVDTTREFESGIPRALFTSAALSRAGIDVMESGSRRSFASVSGRSFSVSKDGTRFLVNLPQKQAAATPLTVVVNWLATIQH